MKASTMVEVDLLEIRMIAHWRSRVRQVDCRRHSCMSYALLDGRTAVRCREQEGQRRLCQPVVSDLFNRVRSLAYRHAAYTCASLLCWHPILGS